MLATLVTALLVHLPPLSGGLNAPFAHIAHPASQPPSLITEVLADGIYLLRAPSALDLWTATNVVVIVNEDDVTVFDSFTRASTARMAIAEIRKITDKPVRTLINSHWHQDHWSGNNEFLSAYPGLQIIATTQTRDFMKRMPSGFFAAGLERDATAARTALDSAIRTGKTRDGSDLSMSERRRRETDIQETADFAREIRALPRVLPTVAFRDTMIFWRGQREFRLFAATGDATGSAVLYLPRERLLVTGDVLVARENGQGSPPWTTNSFSIAPWVNSLKALLALDVRTIVPGQGLAFHDKTYLQTTIDLFAAVIAQVHAALERGVTGPAAVRATIDVDAIGRRYTTDGALPTRFHEWVASLTDKVYQEALDGIAR
jgi:glyoxylase-like metal-dependent hydrolase (beta-lactamase superfamily II)